MNATEAINKILQNFVNDGWQIESMVATPGESLNHNSLYGYFNFDQVITFLFSREIKEKA